MAKKRFEQKEEKADWKDERRVKAFEEVIKLGIKKRDLLQNSYGWKIRWLEEIVLFKYEK